MIDISVYTAAVGNSTMRKSKGSQLATLPVDNRLMKRRVEPKKVVMDTRLKKPQHYQNKNDDVPLLIRCTPNLTNAVSQQNNCNKNPKGRSTNTTIRTITSIDSNIQNHAGMGSIAMVQKKRKEKPQQGRYDEGSLFHRNVAKKSVTFSTQASIKFTTSWRDYSKEELHSSWYARTEYKLITQECCKQVCKMEKGEIFKDKKYCSRGLESYTRMGARLKSMNRRMAYDAIFYDAERQILLDTVSYDIGKLSWYKYRNVSSSCQLWASRVGLQDQKDAEDYNLPLVDF